MQRFLAHDIKMTLDNVEPLDNLSSLRWQDITGQYMAVEMKETIGSKLVESVEVSVSLTSQDPPPVSRRALLGKKMSALRRLQIAEELTFDADVSIRSDLDESTVSRHIKEILEKNEYLAALRQSGDSSFANVDSVSVPPVTSLTRMEDSADNKPEIALIVGSVVAGFAVVCLAAHAFVRRRTKQIQHGIPHDKGGDSSTTVDIYVEDAVNATSSKSPSPKWLSHRLGFTKKSSFHSFETPKGTASDVDEESLFVSSLTDRPTYALTEADEESIGGTTLSSITTGFSYPAADWSLPPTRIADECTVSSYWTKDDDISVTEIEVRAPAGALGIVLETPNGGVPRVNHINSNGPLAGRVRLGDRLVAVDGRNVTSMNAAAVSRLIASKKDNAARELIFARPK
jgi:DNA-binding transcriptional ArsR family regulator